jgi:enamine deaminase RidA (YjgF/YER057c/UK114 family)
LRDSIESETAASFDRLVAVLAAAGAEMRDLVNLRTYYVYDGAAGRDVTEYWERMTAVRLRYLADPGPAATAVRVAGLPSSKHLIGVDGIAVVGEARRRIMPEDAWDWSIPTPFSQGWRIADTIYLGGQISADRQGKAVAIGDAVLQTRNCLDYIRQVLDDAGASWGDLATLRVCYRFNGSEAETKRLLDSILGVVQATLPVELPAITAFGVDLLYEGLLLEIDGVALKRAREPIAPAGADTWMRLADFPIACRSGNEIYIGGLSAPGAASLAAQADATLGRLGETLSAAGVDFASLAKLTVFYVSDRLAAEADADVEAITGALADYLPRPGPVVTILKVNALPHDGQRFQIDGIAII